MRCLATLFLFLLLSCSAQAAPAAAELLPNIVAAETVYADIARSIAPPGTHIVALIANPAQDPHLFEAGPAAARQLSAATIVIYNGAGYDPWMRDLLASTAGPRPRQVIDVADLVHAASGGNPHLWYDPHTGLALATVLAARLSVAEPRAQAAITQRLARFRATIATLETEMAKLSARHPHAPIAATEPVFGLMLNALGFRTLDPDFELAVQNNVEPAASSLAALQDALRKHAAAALIVNTQAETDLTRHLMQVARHNHVPIVEVSETEPAGLGYAAWLTRELAALSTALDAAP